MAIQSGSVFHRRSRLIQKARNHVDTNFSIDLFLGYGDIYVARPGDFVRGIVSVP